MPRTPTFHTLPLYSNPLFMLKSQQKNMGYGDECVRVYPSLPEIPVVRHLFQTQRRNRSFDSTIALSRRRQKLALEHGWVNSAACSPPSPCSCFSYGTPSTTTSTADTTIGKPSPTASSSRTRTCQVAAILVVIAGRCLSQGQSSRRCGLCRVVCILPKSASPPTTTAAATICTARASTGNAHLSSGRRSGGGVFSPGDTSC